MRHNLSYRIFVSDSLKERILSIIKKHPPIIKNFKKDKLLYILSLIHEIPARNKRKGLSDSGYANLYSSLLQEFVPDYRRYLDYLLLHGIIECDNLCIPGYKSKGYKIAENYIALVEPATIQNPELIRKIKRYKPRRGNSNKYNYLKKCMDGLEIDFLGALDYNKAQYAYRKQHPDNREYDYKKKRCKNPINQYNSASINIYYLKDKRYYFYVDPNVHRLHTNLTNFPSDLRNFITWKEKKLVSIDISNSQPYLSTILFRPSFYSRQEQGGKKLTVFSFSSSFFSLSNSSSSNPFRQPASLMLGKTLQWDEKQDVKLFIRLVEKGQLYEYLEDAFNSELGMTFRDRKNIKAAVFQVLFTDNRFIGQQEAAPKRLFKKLFPNVYELFATYKKGDKSILPRLLQQMEAMLILDIICKRISREKPDVPLFTIHDSITTTVDNLAYVQRIMKEELTHYIGIEPNLKIEYWMVQNIKVANAS